eukprot:scaffold26521_cov69-Phaeocystis_antarctica.AAC.3
MRCSSAKWRSSQQRCPRRCSAHCMLHATLMRSEAAPSMAASSVACRRAQLGAEEKVAALCASLRAAACTAVIAAPALVAALGLTLPIVHKVHGTDGALAVLMQRVESAPARDVEPA